MAERSDIFRKSPATLLASLLVAVASCSQKYELLKSLDETGGSANVGPSVGGSANVSRGGNGSGGATIGGNSAGIGGNNAGIGGNSLIVGGESADVDGGSGGIGGAGAESCSTHQECTPGKVCTQYRCVSCPSAPATCAGPCEHGFSPKLILRNGCSVCECVPPSACMMDADCPSGEHCYPGAQCEDDCTTPACCYGNQCSTPGCNLTSPPPTCLVAGCSGGRRCLASCDTATCECDGANWTCTHGTAGSCTETCAL